MERRDLDDLFRDHRYVPFLQYPFGSSGAMIACGDLMDGEGSRDVLDTSFDHEH